MTTIAKLGKSVRQVANAKTDKQSVEAADAFLIATEERELANEARREAQFSNFEKRIEKTMKAGFSEIRREIGVMRWMILVGIGAIAILVALMPLIMQIQL